MSKHNNIHLPPLKSQGIKTKLIPWIQATIPYSFNGVWVEPFMGTGIVGFNIAPDNALMCDTNPHIIKFYNFLKNQDSDTLNVVKDYLLKVGHELHIRGDVVYYEIRDRFNETHNPLDFLFLSRTCFNGVMRFNSNGVFNVPFCKNTRRLSKNFISKLVAYISYVMDLFLTKNFEFICQDFKTTIQSANKDDLIYCDPPYIGRDVGYFNKWVREDELSLFNALNNTSSKFILSTWSSDAKDTNPYIDELWSKFSVTTQDHSYFVGGKGSRRPSIKEALVTNF